MKTAMLLLFAAALVAGAAAAPENPIPRWLQCGGIGGNCTEYGACADAIFPEYSCEEGFTCQRQQSYYWQCLDGSNVVPDGGNNAIGPWQQCGGAGGYCHTTSYAICEDREWPNTGCANGWTCMRQNEWYWQCNNGVETTVMPESSPVPTTTLNEWAQCGGMGGDCAAYTCVDGPYPNTACAGDGQLVCVRQSEWYYQCLNSANMPSPNPEPVAPVEIAAWLQCGGRGANCTTVSYGVCDDAQFPDTSCVPGFHCQRQDEWYWGCTQ